MGRSKLPPHTQTQSGWQGNFLAEARGDHRRQQIAVRFDIAKFRDMPFTPRPRPALPRTPVMASLTALAERTTCASLVTMLAGPLPPTSPAYPFGTDQVQPARAAQLRADELMTSAPPLATASTASAYSAM